MEIATQWAILAAATAIAAGLAFGLAWAFLAAALHLMQPAGRPARPARPGLHEGTRLLGRAYAKS